MAPSPGVGRGQEEHSAGGGKEQRKDLFCSGRIKSEMPSRHTQELGT